jgi:signal transduction histidine kinase
MVLTARKHVRLYAGSAALLAAITWIDYITGYEFGFFVFYFIPVGLAAWFGSRGAGIAFAFAAAVCWYFADRLALHPYSNSLLIYWETFMRLVTNFTTALALSTIRQHVQSREDLLRVVSHDLRTPLGAVMGQAKILLRRGSEDAFTVARAEAILLSAGRMSGMIEDLLDGARLESGQLRLDLDDIDLQPYLDELLGRIGESLEVKRVEVSIQAPGRVTVRADPRRLERVLLNLLSNALKHCPDGTVRLEVVAHDGWVSISVVDAGQGIHPDELPHLFTRFYRGRHARGPEGLGLGLYSARMMVEAHGGRIDATSSPGAGTRFRVRLPARAP